MSNKRKPKKPWLRVSGTTVDPMGLATNVAAPRYEKVVVKEVPAKVDGVVVGSAVIYEDGEVDVIVFDDAPQWAKDKIKAEADQIGFQIGALDGPT